MSKQAQLTHFEKDQKTGVFYAVYSNGMKLSDEAALFAHKYQSLPPSRQAKVRKAMKILKRGGEKAESLETLIALGPNHEEIDRMLRGES